ncbi:MAG: FHA domain-containing protein [Clostridium sp.]|nr:FHA domain-containing protein [Clostridium sp.]
MRKKIGLWMMALLLLFQSGGTVYAAPEENSIVQAVSGYCLGEELYTFIRMNDGYDVDSFTVGLQSDAVSAAGEQALVPITETTALVRYVFMIDLTGSMRKYAGEVDAFVGALMEAEEQEALYTVAVFGERFEVVSENMTDENAVKRVLEELKYTERMTDPYTGVERALTYLDGCSRRSGDLIHLVVITDGDPDLGIEDEEESREKERMLAESAARKIESTPEVIVSTICMAEWDTLAFQTFSAGNGNHETIGDERDAADAGKKMADYVDSLYRISFRLSSMPDGERFSVGLKLRGKDQNGQRAIFDLSIEGVANLRLFSDSTQEDPGQGEQGGIGGLNIGTIDGNGDGTEAGDADRSGDEAEAEGGGDKADSEGAAGSGGKAEDVPDGGDKTDSEDAKDGEDGTEAANADGSGDGMEAEGAAGSGDGMESEEAAGSDKKLIWAGAAIAVVIAAGICVILLSRRKQRREKAQTEAAGTGRMTGGAAAAYGMAGGTAAAGKEALAGGIAMRLEVYAGNCRNKSVLLKLTDSFVIGSAPECGLVFGDADVAPQNSRVFIKNQMIYIEDLNSPSGTALGGMRIQGQNRLRSGDIISIGNVEFSFKF